MPASSTATSWQSAISSPLSVNDTVPPSGVGLTVAVNVTSSPGADGFSDGTSPVDVGVGGGASLTT